MAELKPCPFCGGEATMEQTTYGTTDMKSCRLGFTIRCVGCGATTPKCSGYIAINLSGCELNLWHDDRFTAMNEWNTRAERMKTGSEDISEGYSNEID